MNWGASSPEFVNSSKINAGQDVSSRICKIVAVTSASTVEVMVRCEIPRAGMILWLVELTQGHRVPRLVSSTAPEENEGS